MRPVAALLLVPLSASFVTRTTCATPDSDVCGTHASASSIAARHASLLPTLEPAKGRFLIASRTLLDPNFSESVVLLLAREPGGTMGVVINRPTDVRLATALPKIEELRGRTDRVYLGGPVATNAMLILVRAARKPKSSERIFGDVYASGSLSALRQALGKTGTGNRLRAYAGHAGWGSGQLEREIARGDWYVVAADAATIFERKAPDIWPKLIERFSGEWTQNRSRRLRVVSLKSEHGCGEH